jgi:hypothetical protein
MWRVRNPRIAQRRRQGLRPVRCSDCFRRSYLAMFVIVRERSAQARRSSAAYYSLTTYCGRAGLLTQVNDSPGRKSSVRSAPPFEQQQRLTCRSWDCLAAFQTVTPHANSQQCQPCDKVWALRGRAGQGRMQMRRPHPETALIIPPQPDDGEF